MQMGSDGNHQSESSLFLLKKKPTNQTEKGTTPASNSMLAFHKFPIEQRGLIK
jgi:hypothetical protein